ncbi:MAG: hypothetical protein RL885_06140 [Planctomycetota bacterium]
MTFRWMTLLAAAALLSAPVASAQRGTTGPPNSQSDGGLPQIQSTTQDVFGIRYEPATGPRDDAGWIWSRSNNWTNIPKAAASFVAQDDFTNVAVTFSAEVLTTASNKRLFVRALIDGQVADPSDVVFVEGPFKSTRSFTFTDLVGKGIHTVEMQWLIDSDYDQAPFAYMRSQSVHIRFGLPRDEGGSIWTSTPPGGESFIQSPGWIDLPDGGGDFWVPEKGQTILTFSAEAFVSGGDDKRLFIRPVIDGVAAANPGDVVFTRTSSRGVRQMAFELPNLSEGWHNVQMQWLVDPGGFGTMGDRSLVVTSYPSGVGGLTHKIVVPPSGPSVKTDSDKFKTVPGLSTIAFVPENGELSVSVSGEVFAPVGSEVYVRLNVGGQVLAEEELRFTGNGHPTSVASFVFDRKHVFGGAINGISIEWRVVGGGTALFGDRSMAIMIEPGMMPDLAEAPPFGGGNVPLEPQIGTRKLLTILWDANRPAPHDQAPPIADVADALFGAHSVRDFLEINSGGRLTIQNEGILGWFNANNPWDYYWNTHPGCGGGSLYNSGHQEKWAEAILEADLAGFNFASYDTNSDGVLQTSELGIMIVIVQDTDFGTAQKSFSPHCDGSPFVVDGVQIPELFEWYTSDPKGWMATAAHELSHLFFDLGDLYINGYNADTEPGNMSLMASPGQATAHFDPFHKLYMGWVDPIVVEESGLYDLADVKLSEQVLILPRRNGGDGREYFIIENRQTSGGNPFYDESIASSGIAIWHIIESPSQNALAPTCTPQGDWDNLVSGNGRRGIRLMRPGISWGSLTPTWRFPYYDLLDDFEVCPSPGDDVNFRRNVLKWADGTPSDYLILDWPTSAPVMTLNIHVDN